MDGLPTSTPVVVGSPSLFPHRQPRSHHFLLIFLGTHVLAPEIQQVVQSRWWMAQKSHSELHLRACLVQINLESAVSFLLALVLSLVSSSILCSFSWCMARICFHSRTGSSMSPSVNGFYGHSNSSNSCTENPCPVESADSSLPKFLSRAKTKLCRL